MIEAESNLNKAIEKIIAGFIEDDYSECCKFFGCGKKLSMTEQLCGNRCADHPVKESELFYNGLL